MKKQLIALVALFLCISATGRGDSIDDFLKEEMQRQHIPGLSVAVLRNGSQVKAEGYGFASVELNVAASKATVYEIASVTKPVTAAAVLLLVEEKRLRLDDPVHKHAAGIPSAWKKITIRQVLSHTSGIPRDAFRINSKTERQEYTRKDILELIANMPLLFEPGARFSYSNLGYYLLGIVIEETSGMPYAEFLDKRVFKPLGMHSARVNDNGVVILNRAHGYEWQGELKRGAYQSPSFYAPAGGIVCSVVDLAKWETAISKPGFLKSSSLSLMHRPTQLANGQTCAYGLGWNVDYLRGRRDINHRGSNGGFSSTLHRYVEDGLAIIVMANLAAADLERVARGVAAQFIPEFMPLSLMNVRSDPHAAWSRRLREGLFALAQGKMHPAFSPEFVDEFTRLNRARSLAARLGQLDSLLFLASRSVGKWQGNRPGGVVDRLEYYRLKSGARTQGYVFSVDADGRVLWLEVEEEPAHPSEMEVQADQTPAITQRHQILAMGWAAGRMADSEMTSNLKAAFNEETLRSYQELLKGMTGLRFLASRDLTGDTVSRLGVEIACERYYRVEKQGLPLFMVCYLGSGGEIADVELPRR